MSFPEADRDFEFSIGQDALGFIDDKGIFDHTDDAHRLLAFWTYQGVYLVDFFLLTVPNFGGIPWVTFRRE